MKLINGLKNGTIITKVCLTLIIILSPVTLISGLIGLLTGSVPAIVIAIVCLCGDIYLIVHLQTIKRQQREEEERKNRTPLFSAGRDAVSKGPADKAGSEAPAVETVKGKKKAKIVENWREAEAKSTQPTAQKQSATVIEGRDENDWGLGQVDTGLDATDSDIEEFFDTDPEEKQKARARLNEMLSQHDDIPEDLHKYDEKSESKDDDDEDEEENVEGIELPSEESLENIDEKEFQKTLKKLGVTADAFPVLIDIWRVQRIRQCPAYMWIAGNDMKIATLSDPPKKFKIPVESFRHINHIAQVSANPREDYKHIKKSIPISRVFSPLIPDYEKQGISNNFRYYKKQYTVGRDLALTPGSARELRKRINFELTLMNSAINRGNYNHYFKDAYKNKVMWGDGVITKQEYQEFMKKLLSELSCDKAFGDKAFNDAISEMLRARLINEDYANYFSGMRNARLDGSDF